MPLKLFRDPFRLPILGLLVGLMVIYQAGGGDTSSSVFIRDCLNYFWLGVVLFGCYLALHRLLRRWGPASPTRLQSIIKSSLVLVLAGLATLAIIIIGFVIIISQIGLG